MDQQQLIGLREYLPTASERKLLTTYHKKCSEGDDTIDDLCECEKFMVAMLRVKHANRKVRALIFKLQFMKSIDEVLNGES